MTRGAWAIASAAAHAGLVLFAFWLAWQVGKAIDDAWNGDGDNDFMLVSCNGQQPRGWDE